MGKVSQEAGHRPAGAAKHRGAKPPVSAKRSGPKTARCQLHLGEETVKRLGVHCSLEGVNNSREADRILLQWLKSYGKGRAIFDSPDPVDLDDRAAAGGEISGGEESGAE